MKKLLALLLALIMIFALVACGEDKKDDAGNGDDGGNNGGSTTASTTANGGDTDSAENYEDALLAYLEGAYGINPDNLDTSAPDAFWDFCGYKEGMLYEAKYAAGVYYENTVAMHGEGFTLSILTTTKTDVTGDDFATLAAAFEEQKGVSAADVKALAEVYVEFQFSGIYGTQNGEELVKMVQIGNKWYVAEWQVYDEGCYVLFAVEMMVGG